MRSARSFVSSMALAIALTMAFAATPALAAQPVIEKFEDTNEDNPDIFEDACGVGHNLMGVFHETVTVTTFFDQEGNVREIKVQIHFLGEITSLVTGKSLKDPGYFTEWIDPETGAITHNGLVFGVTYPGYGMIYQATGRIIFSADFDEVLWVAGPHNPVEEGPSFIEVLCEALS